MLSERDQQIDRQESLRTLVLTAGSCASYENRYREIRHPKTGQVPNPDPSFAMILTRSKIKNCRARAQHIYASLSEKPTDEELGRFVRLLLGIEAP